MNIKRADRKNGFTMTEILVVIVILGGLAAFAVPRFTGSMERVRAAEGVQILTALLGAQKAFQIENNGNYSAALAALDVEFNNAAYFDLPPSVANPANPVGTPIATIVRTGAYRLGINEEGTLCCKNVGAAFTCAQAGILNDCP